MAAISEVVVISASGSLRGVCDCRDTAMAPGFVLVVLMVREMDLIGSIALDVCLMYA